MVRNDASLNEQPQEPQKGPVYSILTYRKVNRIVVIDDIVGYEGDLPQLIGWTTVLSEDQLVKVRTLGFGLDKLSEDSDARREQLTTIFSELDVAKRLSFERKIADALEQTIDETLQVDYKRLEVLKRECNGIEVRMIRPEKWRDEREEIVNSQNCDLTLCLFDLDLSKSHGFTATSGITLLKELLALGSQNVITGILSHNVQLGSEREHWNSFAEEHDLAPSSFLPLSKASLNKSKNFARGIKDVVVNHLCEQVKERLAEIQKKATTTAQAAIEKMDFESFEHIVLKSSASEGVSEMSTLSRVFGILSTHSAEEFLLQAGPPAFQEQIAMLRSILSVEVAPGEAPSTSKFRVALRHKELYVPANILNPSFLAIENGDIFMIGDQTYILVAQPCSIMVRTHGARTSVRGKIELVSTLLRVLPGSLGHKQVKELASAYGVLWYLNPDSDKAQRVEFDSPLFLDTRILDLCAFQSDGRSRFDLHTQPTQAPVQLHTAWLRRFEILQAWLVGIKEQLEIHSAEIGAISDERVRELANRGVAPHFDLPETIDPLKIYNYGVFDFGIKRVLRLREPEASSLLRQYSAYQAREAKEHDFARSND
jgi:hypothetical protein